MSVRSEKWGQPSRASSSVSHEASPAPRMTPTFSNKPRDSGAWTFFLQWLKSPLSTAALSPSGKQLAARMMDELPCDAHRIIELGAGTGVFTQALIDRGIAPHHLLALELNESLAKHLQDRFQHCHIHCGDARKLRVIAEIDGFLDFGPADAIVSGLGLLSMNRKTQREILEAALSVLKEDGRFIQFTYGPTSPIAPELLRHLGLNVRRGRSAFWNLPPATVYVYTRAESRARTCDA